MVSGQRNRRLLRIGNKYQEHVVLLCFLPTLILSLFWFLMFGLANLGMLHEGSPWLNIMVVGFSAIFVMTLILIFAVSRNLVGPFERINFELDEIIKGRSQKMLTARPNDYLANVLLPKINILIKFYIEHKR